MYRKMNKEGGERIDIDFGESLEVMKSRYMMYMIMCMQKLLQQVDLMKMWI